MQVGELAVADADPVAVVEGLGSGQGLVVEVGPVRRSEILDDRNMALERDAGVTRGREWVVELDLDVSAAERSAPQQVIGHSALVPGRLLDQQPRFEVDVPVDGMGGVVHAGRQ